MKAISALGPAQWKTYGIIAIIIIAILIFANMGDDETTPTTSTEAETHTNAEVHVKEGELVHGYTLGAFEQADKAATIINSSQGKPTAGDGSESPLSWIVDSNQDNMVFFATESLAKETNPLFSGIYHYNTSSSRWQRVYKTEFRTNEGEAPKRLRVIGRADNQLILLKEASDTSVGTCFSPWIAPGERLVLLLDDPYAGFNKFIVPEELAQEEERKTTECLKQLTQ